jgi:hypothetical protein
MFRSSIGLCIAVLVGCGSGGGSDPDAGAAEACLEHGGAACFQLPTAPMTTAEGEASTIGCGPVVPEPSTEAVTYTGFVQFFGGGEPIAGAEVEIFPSGAFDTPVASATSGADGAYTLTFPAGTPDVLWASVTAPGALLNYRHAFRLDLASGDVADFDIAMFTPENIEGASVLVEERWDPERAGIAGLVLDCDRRVIMHAAVTVSSVSGLRCRGVASSSTAWPCSTALPARCRSSCCPRIAATPTTTARSRCSGCRRATR